MGGLHQDDLPFLETASRKDFQCGRTKAQLLSPLRTAMRDHRSHSAPRRRQGPLYSGQFLSLSMAAVVLETLLTSHTQCLSPQIFISLNQSSVEGPITSVEKKQNRRNLRRPPETPRLSLVQRS